MRTLIVSVLAVLSLNGFAQDNDLAGFKANHITIIMEIPHSSGEHLTFNKPADLIYSNKYLILKGPHYRTTIIENINHDGAFKNSTSSVDTIFAYFICKRGEQYGLQYDSLSAPVGKRFFVDSLVSDYLRAPAFFYMLRGKGKDSMTVIRDDKNGLLTEKFKDKSIAISDPDSSYFYYRKKPLDFPFLIKEKRQDNMYLYKSVMIYKAIPKGTNPDVSYDIKKFKFYYEITEIDVPDMQEIKVLIDRFKKSFNRKEK